MAHENQQLLAELDGAIRAIRATFGPPGDYGYSSAEGRALNRLYSHLPALWAALDGAAVESPPSHGSV
jgi:hypothetical protein